MVHLANPSAGESGLLQSRIQPAFRQAISNRGFEPRRCHVRSGDAEVYPDRTCFPTHHLAFWRDHNMLFFSAGVGGPGVLGWLDLKY